MTPQNMSILNLVLQASWVVQLVMLLLQHHKQIGRAHL